MVIFKSEDVKFNADMPIKNFFIPDNALQGEDLPAFVLWNNIDYDRIEIEKSSDLKIKDIFNVSDNNYSEYDENIIINSVEVDGYLGLVFKSFISEMLLINIDVIFNFIKNEEVIEKVDGKIVLFRPKLELYYQPHKINILNGIVREDDKIILKNIGEGTCNIIFKESENSELKIESPSKIREFVTGFETTLVNEINEIIEKFPVYESELNDLIYLTITTYDPSDEEKLNEIKIKEEKIEIAFNDDEDLLKSVIQAFSISIIKNLNIITMMEQFIDFLLSIAKGRILLINALDVIKVYKEPKKLELFIYYTDLLNNNLEPIILEPITIISNKETEISLYNFFKWENEQNEH